MFYIRFISLVLLMTNVYSNEIRFDVIESRLTTLEMRMNMESKKIKSTVKQVEHFDELMSKIGGEKKCHTEEKDEETDVHKNEQNTKSFNEIRVIKAFKEQKKWLNLILENNENITRQCEFKRLSFEEKFTNYIAEQLKEIKSTEIQFEEKIEYFLHRLDTLETNFTSFVHKKDDELLRIEIRELKERETKQNARLARLEDAIVLMETNLTSFIESEKNLTKQLEERDKDNENLTLELIQLKDKQKAPETVKICPLGWHYFCTYCYLIGHDKMIYPRAQKFCAAEGAHIADVENDEENKFLSKLSKQQQTWIGITDEETEGQWIADRTGTLTTYTNWAQGQPNNVAGRQDCAIMGEFSQKDLWGDVPCDFSYRVICKR